MWASQNVNAVDWKVVFDAHRRIAPQQAKDGFGGFVPSLVFQKDKPHYRYVALFCFIA